MRTFFAIKPPESFLDKLEQEISPLQTTISHGVKWTPREQLHLTLKFLDTFSQEHVDLIHHRIYQATRSIDHISIKTTTTGFFPPKGNIRVIWYGIEQNRPLAHLAKMIEESCSHFGYQQEKRPFKPHFTIGRVKRNTGRDDGQFIRNMINNYHPSTNMMFPVSKLSFIQSTLTPVGPEYQILFSISL